MIYYIYNQLLRITIRVFFRHIHASNVANVPLDKPVIIAANHPGTFLDPILIACVIGKPIHFLVRGDVFKNKVVRFVFERFNMIPVYRKDEGYENVEKNLDTNAKVSEILKQNGIVVIFCEGYSSTFRRLRTILKGTARISMQTAMDNNIDVQIVPTGITYTHKTSFRKSMMIEFSKPIAVKDFVAEYTQHPQKGYVSITAEIEKRLQKNLVVVNHVECDAVAETSLNYLRNTESISPLPIMVRNTNKLAAERNLCESINRVFEADKHSYDTYAGMVEAYELELANDKCDDLGVVSGLPTLFETMLLVLGFPFFVLGFLFWGVPYLIAKKIADHKVTRIEYHDALAVNSVTVLFSLSMVALMLAFYPCIGIFTLLIGVLMPLVGVFAGWYYDQLLKMYFVFQAVPHKIKLREMRDKITNFIV